MKSDLPAPESGVHINHYKNRGALTSEALSWEGSCSSGGEEGRGIASWSCFDGHGSRAANLAAVEVVGSLREKANGLAHADRGGGGLASAGASRWAARSTSVSGRTGKAARFGRRSRRPSRCSTKGGARVSGARG